MSWSFIAIMVIVWAVGFLVTWCLFSYKMGCRRRELYHEWCRVAVDWEMWRFIGSILWPFVVPFLIVRWAALTFLFYPILWIGDWIEHRAFKHGCPKLVIK